jgi:hypothetical protein
MHINSLVKETTEDPELSCIMTIRFPFIVVGFYPNHGCPVTGGMNVITGKRKRERETHTHTHCNRMHPPPLDTCITAFWSLDSTQMGFVWTFL